MGWGSSLQPPSATFPVLSVRDTAGQGVMLVLSFLTPHLSPFPLLSECAGTAAIPIPPLSHCSWMEMISLCQAVFSNDTVVRPIRLAVIAFPLAGMGSALPGLPTAHEALLTPQLGSTREMILASMCLSPAEPEYSALCIHHVLGHPSELLPWVCQPKNSCEQPQAALKEMAQQGLCVELL